MNIRIGVLRIFSLSLNIRRSYKSKERKFDELKPDLPRKPLYDFGNADFLLPFLVV